MGPAKASDAEALAKTLIRAYAVSLAQGKAHWVERDTAQGPVKILLDRLRTRQRHEFLGERTQKSGKRRALRIDGVKTLAASRKQRERIQVFMDGFVQEQPNPKFYKVLDVARRIAGTGSLGVDRYVLLVQGKGSPDSK